MKKVLILSLALVCFYHCNPKEEQTTEVVAEQVKPPFLWENANIYFLLTDRFNNGNPGNDTNFERDGETAILRGFEGGDISGITQKINEGYFTDLGINAIWFTPVVEQVHGIVDEGTGATYGYHGYWAKDWTALDPNFGTEADLANLVSTAHKKGIRIVFDVVINHTGPVTDEDPVWPKDWVRTTPQCDYQSYDGTVSCTLVKNLPDILTGSDTEVDLPQQLKDKWEREGRLEKEMQELDEFFNRTGYPRAPRFYIMKWIADYVKKYGIDAFRVDTAKHTEAGIWAELYNEAVYAFALWKAANPDKVLDNNGFFMFGEVYNYNISHECQFNYGDQTVDFFSNGFQSLINFEFKYNAQSNYESLFSKYDSILNDGLKGNSIVNYLTSHDDGDPFDKNRAKPFETGTKLLLCPGSSQVYYGDELSRPLVVEGAEGDANLRSFMNWSDLQENTQRGIHKTRDVLAHWQKLGRFRAEHPAVGAGRHNMITAEPYVFSRTLKMADYEDAVVAGLDMEAGEKVLDVSSAFEDGQQLRDYYSGLTVSVKSGRAVINSAFDTVLLGKI